MKRRFSTALLTLLFLLSLSACGSDGGASSYTYLPTASNDTICAVIPDGSQGDISQPQSDAGQSAPEGNDTVDPNEAEGNGDVSSNDGLVYYTDDHYESFELLYGEP